MRILIADDEPLVAEGLRARLNSLGFTVVDVAFDGRAAVARAEALAPDLIFLDVKMPLLDGITAAERIMATRPVPMIILTAHSDATLIERAMQVGVMGYLVKPVNGQELLPAITLARTRFAELMALRQEAQSLQAALHLRQQVARAAGILARRLGVSQADAQQHLQRYAAREGCTLDEAASRVIGEDGFFADLDGIP